MNLNLTDYADKLSKLCAAYGVKRLELFGSASRRAFDRYFGLKEDLERLFQRPVDLVERKAIKNPYFRQAIEQDKVLVYGT